MKNFLQIPLGVVLFSLTACSSTPQKSEPKESQYVFVYLKKGPEHSTKSPEDRQQIQFAHLENIRKLAADSKLVLAGPFGKPVHDPEHRGVFVFNVTSLEEARKLTDTDPAVKAGVLSMELHSFESSSSLRKILDFERESDAQAAKEGRVRQMGEGIRGFVMLTAIDAQKAEKALAPLFAQKKILVSGRFGGDFAGRGVYVLDATSVEKGEALLGSARSEMGEVFLDSWWATKNLSRLSEVAPKAP